MNVLLADDSRVTRKHLGTVLSAAGHDVFEACNGDEAWQTLQRVPAPLVILDWMMPVMDGLELLRRIRGSGHLRDTFVMMITVRGTPQDVLVALEAGADDFATKPMTSDSLRARVIVAERHIQQRIEARRVEEALQRAKWLAGVGEAVVTMQHEINVPLAVIMLEQEAMAKDPAMPEKFRERLVKVGVETERIAAVLHQLSSLKHPRSIEPLRGMRMLDLSTDGDPSSS